MRIVTTFLAALVFGLPLCPNAVRADSLAEQFASPPAEARPWVYWFWMDGNLSREGITADLEAMGKAGIGGMIIMEVDVGIPHGPVHFMSDEWRALFKHAVTEAERLGLQITLNAGPGWTGSGGPWVKAEQSMQHIVASNTDVTGPTDAADIVLPLPAPKPPHGVHNPLPPSVAQARDAFYEDVAVLAFPTPATDAKIADIDEKALYYRNPYSSMPGVKPFLPAMPQYDSLPADATIPRDKIVDLSDRLGKDGHLTWNVPDGKWTVLRFGRRSTGANTRPSPAPAIGLESDKFDKAALDAHFANFTGKLLDELGPRPTPRKTGWTMLHIDSWEMGSQNWTPAFRDEFKRRRGYDPLPYLPAVTGRVVGSIEVSERFLWDWRTTASELIVENHAEHLKELAHRYGMGLSIEPYDLTPCADLDLGGVADVPMCEFWSKGYGFNTSFSCIEATSIAHTLGRPIVAAESFTADSHEAWKLYPGNMKAQADWAFCFGINRLVFHRYAHQPWLDRWPGMTMGPYGVHYERTQTWWGMVGAWHEYLSRCQFMLRRGLPVADILYVAAEGAPHVFRPPPSALAGEQPLPDRRGYNFDGCSPRLLADMTVKDARIILPPAGNSSTTEPMSYRVLVLPSAGTMTPQMIAQVYRLVNEGATIIGQAPVASPSLTDYPACDDVVRQLAGELWDLSTKKDADAPEAGKIAPARMGEGDTLFTGYDQAADTLRKLGVAPDFDSDAPLRYIHRRDGDTEIYFVANGSGKPISARCGFRVTGRVPQLWDAVTGKIRTVDSFEESDRRTWMVLTLGPSESTFVVFQKTPAAVTEVRHKDRDVQSIVASQWQVRFQPNRGAPDSIVLDSLSDLSKHADERVHFFSGEVTYSTTLNIAQDVLAKGQLELDLGQVAVIARVSFNGRDLGVLWTSPFRVDITDAAQAGDNALLITVANLWPNRLIGDKTMPENQRVTSTTWNPYQPNTPLPPSGLLGPVTLQQVK